MWTRAHLKAQKFKSSFPGRLTLSGYWPARSLKDTDSINVSFQPKTSALDHSATVCQAVFLFPALLTSSSPPTGALPCFPSRGAHYKPSSPSFPCSWTAGQSEISAPLPWASLEYLRRKVWCNVSKLTMVSFCTLKDKEREKRERAQTVMTCWVVFLKVTMLWYQPGCWEVTSDRPCLLLRFSRCSLRRFFSSLFTCPRLHFLILHFFLWIVSEQGSPPNWGSIFTMRVLMVWPFPQDLLHSDHSVHSDMPQSIAEGKEVG